MMRRIAQGTVPSFLLMQYSANASVQSLIAIHHSLIVPKVIQERKPLSMTARRAGWIGCNLLLADIPPEGKISIISGGVAVQKHDSRERFKATERLAGKSIKTRSWTAEVLNLLHSLPAIYFTLSDVYKFEGHLSQLYPDNRHIQAKIRQQLQVLRDAGLISFEGSGRYRLMYRSS
jgi:type II restriction enzyme